MWSQHMIISFDYYIHFLLALRCRCPPSPRQQVWMKAGNFNSQKHLDSDSAQKRCRPILDLCVCVSILLPFVSGVFNGKPPPASYFYFFIWQTNLNEMEGKRKSGGDRSWTVGCAEGGGGGYDPAIFLPPPQKGARRREDNSCLAFQPFRPEYNKRKKRFDSDLYGWRVLGLAAAGRDAFAPPDAESDGSRQTATQYDGRPASQRTLQQYCEQIDV